MKILILANDGEGLYKFRKELLQKLVKDNKVYFSLPFDNYIEKLESLGCVYVKTSFNRKGMNPFEDIKLEKAYEKIINSIKPNVALTYTIKPNVYGGLACQKTKIPYIVNITGLGSSIENGGFLQKLALLLYKAGLRKANKVFFQNTTNMNFMVNHKIVKRDKCELIPGSGVNIKDYSIINYPDKKTIEFAYIGRIMKEKGFDQYIEAAKYIKAKYSNTVFHVAGIYEDNYKDIVEKLVKENILVYHGSVIDMVKEIYSIIHCTVHPTYYAEGLSNVLLESLACGRPIITTDRAGCKEVIEDGINGFIVRQKDSKDLIKKIEKFILLSNEEKKNMGLNGRKKVEKEFNRDIVIEKYMNEISKYRND